MSLTASFEDKKVIQDQSIQISSTVVDSGSDARVYLNEASFLVEDDPITVLSLQFQQL